MNYSSRELQEMQDSLFAFIKKRSRAFYLDVNSSEMV